MIHDRTPQLGRYLYFRKNRKKKVKSFFPCKIRSKIVRMKKVQFCRRTFPKNTDLRYLREGGATISAKIGIGR